jgi:hypothetical protein
MPSRVSAPPSLETEPVAPPLRQPLRLASLFLRPEGAAMPRPDLVPDCQRCAGVCCTATSFEASDDFAIDKPAGISCPYLGRDCRCAIHSELLERGFRGCAIYDCHGAGQRVTRAFAAAPDTSARDTSARDEAFLVLRIVHELLWLLTEAIALCPPSDPDLATQLSRQIAHLDALDPRAVADLDLRPERAAAQSLLRRVGAALGGRPRRPRSLAVVGGQATCKGTF